MVILVGAKGFAVTPSVMDMVQNGQNLDYIANYIISHASEFEAYTVDVAKVFLGLSASGVVSGGVTGAQAISVWAKVSAGTAYGLVVALSIYDIVKAYQLISALVELKDIKKAIAEVRYVQRYDTLGVISMASLGDYQEYYVRCYSKPSDTFHIDNGVVYEFIFVDPQYWDGSDFYLIEYPGYFLARYYTDGSKDTSGLLGFMNYHFPYGEPSEEFIDFVTTTGILEKAKQGALSFSYSSQPGYVIWDFMSPGLYKVDPFDEPDISDPLFAETQKIGVITTPDGKSLSSALSPEQWAMVSSLTDIAPYLNFVGMEYGAYRTVPSYENAPTLQEMIDTSKIFYGSNPGSVNVDPETIQAIQEQLETLTQTVQAILAQMQQVQSIPELQQQYQTLQQTQAQVAELVGTLSQTLAQVQTQTQANTQTLECLQEQYQTAVELMTAAQNALETVNNLQQQYQTLQQTQAQVAELVGTLSQTLAQVQTQTQVNTETLQYLQEQYQTSLELINSAQPALEAFVEEYPGLKQQIQNLHESYSQVQSQVQALSQSATQTQEQYQTILTNIENLNSTLTELIQNIAVSVHVDLSPVVQAVNEVSAKVDALTEEVQSLSEYLHEGFFEKLAEKMKELLEELFVPDPEQVDSLFDIKLPKYEKNFAANVSISSESVRMPISLFGASVDLSGYITQYASGLRTFINMFVSGLAAFFVIRAFRVHINID